MKFVKLITLILTLLVTAIFITSCEEECTKMVNIPIYNPPIYDPNYGQAYHEATFIDNYQEVPCDFEEFETEPVNLK